MTTFTYLTQCSTPGLAVGQRIDHEETAIFKHSSSWHLRLLIIVIAGASSPILASASGFRITSVPAFVAIAIDLVLFAHPSLTSLLLSFPNTCFLRISESADVLD